ncbi:MAG: fasciclin domain-containing protein [Candidatus Dependentiae bacterium]
MKKVLGTVLLMSVVLVSANYYSGKLTQTNVNKQDFTDTLFERQSEIHDAWYRPAGQKVNTNISNNGLKTYQQPTNRVLAQKTIAQIVATKPEFSTLRKALEITKLTDTLNGGTEFTIFAPTNAAFNKLRKEVVDELFSNPEKLKSILLYHVVPNKYGAKEVAQLKAAQTVEGEDVKFAVYNGSIRVNNANVSQADVAAKNGIIHVIDTVLIPQE